MGRPLWSILLLLVAARIAAAQSSNFSTRGLGLPNFGLSPRARGTGGSFGLFDPESVLDPAALGWLPGVTATFNAAPEWRHWSGTEGEARPRDFNFPLATVGGPIPRHPFAFRLSLSSYADHDFGAASTDSVNLRGQQVGVFDTLTSTGGLADIGFTAMYKGGKGWNLGATFHIITGSSRFTARRHFADTNYVLMAQRTELAYNGVGISVGVLKRLSNSVAFAVLARSDGKVNVDRDSFPVFPVDLPYTFGGGIMARVATRLTIAGQGIYQTWSGANSDLLGAGGLGAANTYQASLGAEYILGRLAGRTLRFGGHYGTLPFYFTPGYQPREFLLAAGYGTRFSRGRGGVDLSLERAWRWDGSGNREQALILGAQISIRP